MPVLNWRELQTVIEKSCSRLELGAPDSRWFVDRVVVPERARFPGGFVKGEWALRLTSRKQEKTLIISLRPRAPYFTLLDDKGPKAAPGSTQSPFGLAIAKHLKGARLLSVELPPRERAAILWFSVEGARATQRHGLALSLIPALPEALLVREDVSGAGRPAIERGQPGHRELVIIARSRTLRDPATQQTHWKIPDGAQAPAEPPLRDSLASYPEQVERALDLEAFEIRIRSAQREARDVLKQARDRARQSATSISEAEREPDWKRFGDLLKASLPHVPELVIDPPKPGRVPTGHRLLDDYESEEGTKLSVPCDPKLGPSAQVEKFYSMAKRKQRRREEAAGRLETAQEAEHRFQSTLTELDAALSAPPRSGSGLDWRRLESWEKQLGLGGPLPSTPHASVPKHASSKNRWLGKTFQSKDGFNIWVGRSRDENLELTFKHARGNDIWMHVRGRPGAHVVVPIPGGKSAPLETLLDAAVLTIYYSGGASWGKTEVDYTFKKYVKRIKDSTEASYTGNKTLIIEPDTTRLKRLLDEEKGELK